MAEKVLLKGNEALAEAALRAGCRCYFGYPITPQSEIAAYMAKMMPKLGGTFIQAESEIAAINMVLGASAAGARAMTSSSSPGISLKAEGISYIAGSDLPAVIVNIQRGGPGLGGIQPAQSDYWQTVKGIAHGDFRMVVLAPANLQELVDLTARAFDLADGYRMPVMILGDGMLGQMMEPVELPELAYAPKPKPWAADGTRGTRPRNIINSLYIKPEELERLVIERFKRYAVIEKNEVRYEEFMANDADVLVVAYGSSARISKSAVLEARKQGIKAGLFRPITLWPFPNDALFEVSKPVKALVCAEMSMGQMIDDVRLATRCAKPVTLAGRTGGIVTTPEEIFAKIKEAGE